MHDAADDALIVHPPNVGRRGSIRLHRSSLSQSKFFRMIPILQTNHVRMESELPPQQNY
jgi:hypothetical protein